MFNPEIINADGSCVSIGNAYGCAVPLYISELYRSKKQQYLVICRDPATANHLLDDLKFLLPGEQILSFSDYETLPYDSFSPQQDLISNRMEALFTLMHTPCCIVIAAVGTLLQRTAPRSYIEKHVFVLNRGQEISMTEITSTLTRNGYLRVSQVYGQGEFAVRGSLIDLFPSGMSSPYPIRNHSAPGRKPDRSDCCRQENSRSRKPISNCSDRTTAKTSAPALIPPASISRFHQDIFLPELNTIFRFSIRKPAVFLTISVPTPALSGSIRSTNRRNHSAPM